jgi:membrane protease YdiL (CAAX protease family)
MTTACEPALEPQGQSYWTESRRPWTSLVFVAPLLVVYEAGVVALGAPAQNGVDAWLRRCLDTLGFSQYFLLPALTVGILLAWHHLTRQPWRLSRGVLYGMTVECLLLALCLRLLAHVQGVLMRSVLSPASIALPDVGRTLVGYLGAGIYEELLFRLMLLPLVAGALRWARMTPSASMLAAALITSLLFSTAHYIGEASYTLDCYGFLFRAMAGLFFSLLFVYRGFGVAVGAHAGYDVLVGISQLTASP